MIQAGIQANEKNTTLSEIAFSQLGHLLGQNGHARSIVNNGGKSKVPLGLPLTF